MYAAQKILVPVDFSVTSRAAISIGVQMADLYGSKLFFLHVEKDLEQDFKHQIVVSPRANKIEDNIREDERVLREYVAVEYARAEEKGQKLKEVEMEFVIAGGNWLQCALQMIQDEEIDLVISGTHGPKGVKGFLLGSMTEKLLQKANCSVFAVKPQGYPYLRD